MDTRQSETLRLYTALRLLRGDWSGVLLLGVGIHEAGRSLAMASLAAGAASLLVEDDSTRLRAAAREGCCTFSVTTLDEALRALKNEVRQRRAISVALRGEPAAVLSDIVERGVQPECVASSVALAHEGEAAACSLMERGAQAISGLGLCILPGALPLENLLAAHCDGWQIEQDHAGDLQGRRAQDAALLKATDADGVLAGIQRDWLCAAPSLFPRAMERAGWRR